MYMCMCVCVCVYIYIYNSYISASQTGRQTNSVQSHAAKLNRQRPRVVRFYISVHFHISVPERVWVTAIRPAVAGIIVVDSVLNISLFTSLSPGRVAARKGEGGGGRRQTQVNGQRPGRPAELSIKLTP